MFFRLFPTSALWVAARGTALRYTNRCLYRLAVTVYYKRKDRMNYQESAAVSFSQLCSIRDVQLKAHRALVKAMMRSQAGTAAILTATNLTAVALVGVWQWWLVPVVLFVAAIAATLLGPYKPRSYLRSQALREEKFLAFQIVEETDYSPAVSAVAAWALDHPKSTGSGLLYWPEFYLLANKRWGSTKVSLARRIATSDSTLADVLRTANAAMI